MEKVDLNMAFAKHWDRQNPSAFVQACDESRRLRDDEERRKENLRRIEAKTVGSKTVGSKTVEADEAPMIPKGQVEGLRGFKGF
jgi:hypothetical protein